MTAVTILITNDTGGAVAVGRRSALAEALVTGGQVGSRVGFPAENAQMKRLPGISEPDVLRQVRRAAAASPALPDPKEPRADRLRACVPLLEQTIQMPGTFSGGMPGNLLDPVDAAGEIIDWISGGILF